MTIFLHVPKCAGSTFGFHLMRGLKPGEFLPLSYSEIGRRRAPHPALFTRDDADSYLAALSADQKSRLRAVGGHLAFYGLHRYFDRPCRYVTFLRDPFSRSVSHYQFLRRRFEAGGFLTDALRNGLVDCGQIRPFEEWIRMGFPDNYMVRHLTGDVFDPARKVGDADLERAKQILDACFFVGLTETYRGDSRFLYRTLGLRGLYPDRNVSARQLPHEEIEALRPFAASINALDEALHEHGVKIRRRFFAQNPLAGIRAVFSR